MQFKEDDIKQILRKALQGDANAHECAWLKRELQLYSDDEIEGLFEDVFRSIDLDDDLPEPKPEFLPSFKEWKDKRKRSVWFSYKRMILFLIPLLGIGMLVFFNLKKEQVKSKMCAGEDEGELSTANSSYQILLEQKEKLEIRADDTGRVATQGAAELYLTGHGTLEYRQIAKLSGTPDSILMNVIQTTGGNQSIAKLPNGAVVRMNTGSYVIFPISFKNEINNISISGEVLVDVRHADGETFVIHTSNGMIVLKGGRVNINTFIPGTACITQLDGISTINSGNKSSTLKAGEAITIRTETLKGDLQMEKQSTDTLQKIAWKNKLRTYSNISLMDFAIEMSRHYNLEMLCLENLPNKNITLEYCNEASVEELLKLFYKMGIGYSIVGNSLKFCK